MVEGVLADFRSAPISEKEKALFELIDKVNRESTEIRKDDLDRARAAGWTDEAL